MPLAASYTMVTSILQNDEENRRLTGENASVRYNLRTLYLSFYLSSSSSLSRDVVLNLVWLLLVCLSDSCFDSIREDLLL